MATTDSTLEIDIVTSADLTGIQAIQNSLNSINGEAVKSTDIWATMGKTMTESAVQTAAAVKQTGGGIVALGGEVEKTYNWFKLTRAEAAALSRELLSGQVSARGLATSLAGFGNIVAIAAIGVYTIVKVMIDAHAAAAKLRAEWEAAARDLDDIAEGLSRMSAAAKSQEDLASIARTFSAQLQSSNDKLKELEGAAKDDTIARFFVNIGGAIQDLITLQDQWHNDFATGTDLAVQRQKDFMKGLDDTQIKAMRAAEAQVEWAKSLSATPDTIARLNNQLDEMTIAAANAAKAGDVKTWKELQIAMSNLASIIAILTGRWHQLNEEAKKSQEEADRIAREAAEKAKVKQEQEFNAALREGAMILEKIHEQQELINSAPFMGADEKQISLIRQYRTELQEIQRQLARLQTMKGGVTDPAEIARLNAETQKLQFQWQRITQQLSAALHPIRAELQSWVNSWGTSAHQIATTIEDTIGQALQGLNQWIVTGKFNLQGMMQSIEMLGLKLIEQMLLQQLMGKVNAAQSVAQAAITGPAVAAAWAPAATMVTIATQGAAAVAAPEEVFAALFAVQGLALAHEGGAVGDNLPRFHNGGLAPDEVPIIAQTGEIVIQRSVAQANRDFLLALNALPGSHFQQTGVRHGTHGRGGGLMGGGGGSFGMTPSGWGSLVGTGITGGGGSFEGRLYMKHAGGLIGRYHNGGSVGGVGAFGGVHIYAFTDMKALIRHMASRAGQKIIFDTVKGNRIDLGMR